MFTGGLGGCRQFQRIWSCVLLFTRLLGAGVAGVCGERELQLGVQSHCSNENLTQRHQLWHSNSPSWRLVLVRSSHKYGVHIRGEPEAIFEMTRRIQTAHAGISTSVRSHRGREHDNLKAAYHSEGVRGRLPSPVTPCADASKEKFQNDGRRECGWLWLWPGSRQSFSVRGSEILSFAATRSALRAIVLSHSQNVDSIPLSSQDQALTDN